MYIETKRLIVRDVAERDADAMPGISMRSENILPT